MVTNKKRMIIRRYLMFLNFLFFIRLIDIINAHIRFRQFKVYANISMKEMPAAKRVIKYIILKKDGSSKSSFKHLFFDFIKLKSAP